MSLPMISSVPDDQNDWDGWVQNHYANHLDLADSLFAEKQVQAQVYPISHLDRDNMQQWLYWHQLMHNELNQALKITGNNLLTLDWRDPDELDQWIYQNAQEHIALCTALGVN